MPLIRNYISQGYEKLEKRLESAELEFKRQAIIARSRTGIPGWAERNWLLT